MRFVDCGQRDAALRERGRGIGRAERLGCRHHEQALALRDLGEHELALLAAHRSVELHARHTDPAQLLELVLHQREQGRDHEHRLRENQRWDLVTGALAEAGRQHHQHVFAAQQRVDHVDLLGMQLRDAEPLRRPLHCSEAFFGCVERHGSDEQRARVRDDLVLDDLVLFLRDRGGERVQLVLALAVGADFAPDRFEHLLVDRRRAPGIGQLVGRERRFLVGGGRRISRGRRFRDASGAPLRCRLGLRLGCGLGFGFCGQCGDRALFGHVGGGIFASRRGAAFPPRTGGIGQSASFALRKGRPGAQVATVSG